MTQVKPSVISSVILVPPRIGPCRLMRLFRISELELHLPLRYVRTFHLHTPFLVPSRRTYPDFLLLILRTLLFYPAFFTMRQ